jgi:hypothetical protein
MLLQILILELSVNGNNGKMTPEKFLAYFSMFSNSVAFNPTSDKRSGNLYPPGCEDAGHSFVQVVKDIIGAMCEAGIIGTRDHRGNIYKEIKQIIETGIANGRNGAYYTPWAPGNAYPVSPIDFDLLKAKYYTPYGRMCTEKENVPRFWYRWSC